MSQPSDAKASVGCAPGNNWTSESRHGSNIVNTLELGAPEGGERPRFTIFAAMPFDPTFEDVFYVAIESAARALGGRGVRVDKVMHGGDAVVETQREISQCKAVVADISMNEPDVLYELGLAHAMEKPTVQICRTAHRDLPFMVRNRETLLYGVGRTHLLGLHLTAYLKRILAKVDG